MKVIFLVAISHSVTEIVLNQCSQHIDLHGENLQKKVASSLLMYIVIFMCNCT